MSKSTKHISDQAKDQAASLPIAMPAPPFARVAPPASPTSTNWTVTTGGNFNTAANWSNGVPGSGVDATISEASTDQITVTIASVSDIADSLSTSNAGLSLTNATLTLQGVQGGSSITTGTGTALTQAGGLIDFVNGPSQNDTSYISAGGGAVIQTSGTIEVDAGTLDITGNSSFAGTITGLGGKPDSGTVQLLGGSTYSFNTGAALSVGELVTNSTINLAESLTYAGQFLQTGGTLNLGANVFTLNDTGGTLSVLNSAVTGKQFVNQGILSLAGASFATGTTLTNAGSLYLAPGGFAALALSSDTTTPALLANSAGGTIIAQNGTYQLAGGTITNAGLVLLGTGGGLNETSLFTNSGTISVGAGDAFNAENNFTNTGSIAGAGLFEIGGAGTYTLAAGGPVSVGTFELNVGNDNVVLNVNSAAITAGTLALYQGGTVNLQRSITYAGNFIEDANAAALTVNLANFTLALTGSASLAPSNFGADLFAGTGTLALSGATTITADGIQIGEGTTLANSGTLGQLANIQLGDTNAAAAATNAAAGTWDVKGNATLGSSGSNPTSTFANAGLLEMTAANDIFTLDAITTNTGVITTSATALTDIAASLSNTGTIGGAGETEISAGTTTLGSKTVLSTGTFAITGSSLLILGANTAFAGVYDQSSNLDLDGNTLSLTGTANFSGNTLIDGNGTLALSSNTTTITNGATLTLGDNAALTNSGAVTQDGFVQLGDNAGTAASITNAATGTWTMATGDGITRGTDFATTFTNAGLFQDTDLGSATGIYAVFTNTGAIAVPGTELDFYSALTNTGTISGTGAVALRGSASGSLGVGTTLSIGQFDLFDSATLTIGASIPYAGVFDDQGGSGTVINLAKHVLALSGKAFFGGANTYALVEGPGTLTLTGTTTVTSANYGLELGGQTITNNTGTVLQTGQVVLGDSSVSAATVTNKGTWALGTNNGISTGANASSSFTNTKLFENIGAGATQQITAAFINSGTISVASGDETDFTNSLANSKSIIGAGAVGVRGIGSLTVSTGTTINVAQLNLYDSSSLSLGVNLTYAGFFNDQGVNGTTISLGANTLSLTGKANLGSGNTYALVTGTGTLATSGAVTITSSNYGLQLGGTATMVNTGSVLQNGTVVIGDNSGAAATITNSAAGTWSMATNAGIGTGSNASSAFANSGLLKNTGSNDVQTISAVLNNAGTLAIAAGDTTAFTNTLANTGTISGAGALTISAGSATFSTGSVISVASINLNNSAVLDLGLNLAYAGTFNDQGINGTTVNLAGNTLSLTGTATFGSANNDALVNGAGTLSLAGATTITSTNYGLEIGGATALVNTGTLTQTGGLQIGDGSGSIATVTNSASGIWQVAANNTISTGSNASSGFTNAGLFKNIGSGDTERVNAVFNSTGTINDLSAGSTIVLADGGAIGGTLSGAGEIDFSGGNFTLATATALSVATLGIFNAGTNVALTGAAAYAGALNEGSGATLTLGSAASTLTLTGNDSLNGSIAGTGTVLLSTGGTLIADNLTLGGKVVLSDKGGTIAQAQNITIGNNAASTASLSIASGSTYEITGNVTIASQGLGAITNAGTFAMLQGTGTSTIDPLFTNSGTVSSSSGTLVFASDVTNNKSFTATNGHALIFDGAVSTTGTLAGTINLTNGGLAVFGGFVGSAETLTFTDTSSASAVFDTPSNFDGTISGFGGSNALTLADFENAKATSYSGGVLALTGVTDGGTAETIDLHFAGSYTLGSFTIENNNNGGTLILDPKT